MNMSTPLTELQWQTTEFDALDVHRLDAIFRARQQVFAIEQNCVYLDADGCDARSLHVIGWSDAGRRAPAAYARVVQPGVKYAEPSIGRVITVPQARGRGLGREVVHRALAACAAAHPGHAVRISAQTRLERFYADFGFVAVGPPYLEDGIAHTEMLRPFG